MPDEMSIRLSKAKPVEVFSFLSAVAALGRCTIEQVRAHLKAQWPPVRASRSFAGQYQLVALQDGYITLSTLGRRLLRYSDGKRVEFVVRHWRLQAIEPFLYLRQYLASATGRVICSDLADAVKVRFLPRDKWGGEDRKGYGKALAAWMEYMNLVRVELDVVTYVGGGVITPSPHSLLEVEFLRERELRDWFIEEFDSPKSIVEECKGLLNNITKETSDEARGALFHRFIAVSARRLGFSPRTRNSLLERDLPVSFSTSFGGGDLVLYFHHPIDSRLKTYQGGALACEAKSTESSIGSKAVGQARNLASKVQEAFPEHLVVPVVVSRSRIGFDRSGQDQAPPEVVHLTDSCVMELLEAQKKQLSGRGRLVLPPLVFQILDSFIQDENLEPQPDDIASKARLLLEQVPLERD